MSVNTPQLLASNALTVAVTRQFASRPTLRNVVETLLPPLLEEQFPGLAFDLSTLRLFVPLADGTGYEHSLLVDAVLANLAQWQPLELQSGRLQGFIGYPPGTQLRLGDQPLDASKVRELVKLPVERLARHYQAALLGYWQAKDEQGVSRLKWLAACLREALGPVARGTDAAAGQVAQLLAEPEKLARQKRFGAQAVSANLIQVQLTSRQGSQRFLASRLLLCQGDQVVCCQTNGLATAYPTQAAFAQAFGAILEARYQLQGLTWQLYEVEQDPFKVLAEVVLNQQLEDVQALELHSGSPLELERKFATLTDVAGHLAGNDAFEVANRPVLQAAVPRWLQQANPADYYRYRQYWLGLADAQAQAKGQGFMDEVPSLRDYAAKVLRATLLADHPDDPGYDPEHVVLTIDEPVGNVDGFGTVYTHRLPLVDAALENLTGLPKGRMSISHTGGQLIMPWLTADYVKALIRRVDIGAHYPKLIESLMRTDTVQATRRQALYARQLKAQLPLLALEYKIKGEHGLTRDGLRAVTRAMGPDGKGVVVRPLTFLSGQGARPDTVTNMYVFNAQGSQALVLYRPLFEPTLQGFASEAAFFSALARDSALADSILTWLPDNARRLYANGGFAEPHLGIAVDDPAALPGSEPALLGGTALTGDLAAHFYQANVDALLTLADRESTSNHEDRWRMFKEGSWLLFNVVLPLVRGPAAVAGWLLQLVGSLQQDLQQLHAGNDQERAQALVDLLFNMAAVFLHGVGEVTQVPGTLKGITLKGMPPARVADVDPAFGLISPERLQPDLKADRLAALDTALDFSWAGNRTESNPQLRALLERLKVTPPEHLPAAIAEGPGKGLLLIDGQLHAQVKGQLFRVLQQGGDVCIVDAVDPQQRGPWLRADLKGEWRLDLSGRLKGGMPPKRNQSLAQRREELGQQIHEHRRTMIDYDQEVLRLQRSSSPLQVILDERLRNVVNLQIAYQRDRTAFKLQELSIARREAHKAQLLLEPKQAQYIESQKRHLGEWAKQIAMTHEAERRGLYPKAALYLDDLSLYYRGITQTHLFLQGQYFELSKQLQLNDHWFNNAHGVTLPLAADTRLSLGEVLGRASDYMVQALSHAEAVEQLLAEAQANGRLGERREDIETKTRTLATRLNLPGVSQCRVGYLETLARTILDTRITDLEEREYFQMLVANSELFTSALSHAELAVDPEEFTPDERLEVLGGVSQAYSRAITAARYVGELYPATHGNDSLAAYLQTLESLHASAEAELDTLLIKNEPETRPKPPKASGARRVIHTRKRQVLVGKVREKAPEESNDIVDFEGPFGANLVASFREHPGQEFVEIKTVLPEPSVPAKAPGLVGLKKLRKDAKALLDRVNEQKKKQHGFVHSSHDPADIEFPLTALAWSIEEQAGKFERHAALTDADKALVMQMRSAAQGLKKEGGIIRLAMCRQQPPTAANLLYLWQNKQLRITREGTRVAVEGQVDDYLDEYKVVVNEGGVWYAHFHYQNMDRALGDFSKGHLKLEAQRRLGYRAQLAAALSHQQRLEIHRGNLEARFTKGWFPF